MTNKYIVSCYKPPPQLKIKSGDIVKVEGLLGQGNKIRAESIAVGNGPTCGCEPPPKALIGKKISLKGKARKIKYTAIGVQFDVVDVHFPST